jgi:hypothetical protein
VASKHHVLKSKRNNAEAKDMSADDTKTVKENPQVKQTSDY